MTLKPCLVQSCGELSEQSRCPDHRPKPTNKVRPKGHVHTNTTRWKRLSAKARKASPFCEFCSATQTLSADHIIPVSERPDLAHEVVNIRVLCLECNGRRGKNCADEEREAVLQRLSTREARLAKFLRLRRRNRRSCKVSGVRDGPYRDDSPPFGQGAVRVTHRGAGCQ